MLTATLPIIFTLLTLCYSSLLDAFEPQTSALPTTGAKAKDTQALDGRVHHIVLVWLANQDEAELQKTIDATSILAEIPGVTGLKVARAIEGKSPVLDDSFSFGVTMHFESVAALRAYQISDIHQTYLNEYIRGKTSKLISYDF